MRKRTLLENKLSRSSMMAKPQRKQVTNSIKQAAEEGKVQSLIASKPSSKKI